MNFITALGVIALSVASAFSVVCLTVLLMDIVIQMIDNRKGK